MGFVPAYAAINQIHDMVRFPDAVALAAMAHHGSLHGGVLMRVLSELDREVAVLVRQVVKTDQIRNPGDRYRRPEDRRLGNDPVGQLTAVARAVDAQAARSTADGSAHIPQPQPRPSCSFLRVAGFFFLLGGGVLGTGADVAAAGDSLAPGPPMKCIRTCFAWR